MVKGIIGGITTTWNLWATIEPNYEKWKNGGELDDAIAGTIIDGVGIFGGSVTGGALAQAIGGMLGVAGAPLVGLTFVFGGLVWFGYDLIIDPIAYEYYERSKAISKEREEKENAVEDFGDILWW